MSVLLPGDVPWITSASVTRQLAKELLPHLDAELRKPWEESEVEGVDLVDLSQLSEHDLKRVRVALGQVISEVEGRGPSAYPVPSQFPGYVSKLQELQGLLAACAPQAEGTLLSAITFDVGSPYAPDSPWGQDVLEILSDGKVTYRNHLQDRTRVLHAQLTPDASTRVFQLLENSSFPEAPLHTLVPGGDHLRLTVRQPAGKITLVMSLLEASRHASWSPLLTLLQSWAAHLRTPAAKRGACSDLTNVVEEPS